MSFRAAYISYADYGGPLIHTKEFVRAFRTLVPDLVTHCPFWGRDLSFGYPGPESFFNKVFSRLPLWLRQSKLEFYQFRKLLRDLAKWRHFQRIYREHNVDIVILRMDAYVIGAIFAAQILHIPYVLEINGILSKENPDRVTRFFERYCWKNAAGIFAVADPLAKLAVSFGANKQKIRVITNGVRLETFHKSDESVLPDIILGRLKHRIVVGYVGVFTNYHDLTTLLQGFKQCLSVVPNLCLLLIGEGRNTPHTKEAVRQMGIQQYVVFAGKVPHENTPAYLKVCDILVLPLRQIYEEQFHGAPIKLFEYMASQKPIISTEMPSIRQFVHNSVVFVPPGRADMWSESLLALASNPKDREKKAKEAFTHLKKCGYTWEENARRIFRFCDEILQNRGPVERNY